MRYLGMPAAMWTLCASSFRRNLVDVFDLSPATANAVMLDAKRQYKDIIRQLPAFKKGDRFKLNIISAAMVAGVVLCMPQRPDLNRLTIYFRQSMMIPIVKRFALMSGKRKFTPKDIESMKRTAAFRAADRNPYSWNMDFLSYPDGSGYEARFSACGICTLMHKLGLADLTPALCALDYAMSEAGGASDFVRQYTLAEGGPYCDCGYKKKSV